MVTLAYGPLLLPTRGARSRSEARRGDRDRIENLTGEEAAHSPQRGRGRNHESGPHGVLSCFDRMLFRGYLPIMSGWAMAQFPNTLNLNCSNLKPFLLENAECVKGHAVAMAQKHNRPFEYLRSNIRKEEKARQLGQRDGITEGLVCVFSILEACCTFSFHFCTGRPFVQSASRKCLHFYYYFMDRDFGLIHVRIQSWFPMQIEVYLNGHGGSCGQCAMASIGEAGGDCQAPGGGQGGSPPARLPQSLS